MKDFLKNKKIELLILIILGICIIASIIFNIFQLKKNDINIVENSTNAEAEDATGTKEEVQSEEETDSKYLMNSEIGKKNGELIPDEVATSTILEARKDIANAKWSDAYDVLKEKVQQYSLDSEKGLELQNVYYDCTLVKNLDGVEHNVYKNTFKGFRDCSDLLTAFLQIPEKVRRDMFICSDTLSPVIAKDIPVVIKDIEKYEGDYLTDAKRNNEDVHDMYKINFSLENNPLEAYIVKMEDGQFSVYKIKDKDGNKSNYLTTKDWIAIDKESDNNRKIREEKAKNKQ